MKPQTNQHGNHYSLHGIPLFRYAIKSMLLVITMLSFHFTDAQEDLSGLRKLDGYTQVYYASPGDDTRVHEIAARTDNVTNYFKKVLGFKPDTELFILAPKHWSLFAAKPLREVYGFPHNVTSRRLVVASQDNDFWNSFTPPLSQLTPEMASQVRSAYGKPDGSLSMQPFFDLLALHELGHPFHQQGGLNIQRHWMGELFVNLMLHTYVAEKEPALLPALETWPEMTIAGGAKEFTYTNLEDFERLYPTLGMGPRNYGWYQAHLHHAAKQIYDAGGKKVIKKLWVALKKHQDKLSDEAFVQVLQKEVHPAVADVYLKWDQTK